MELRMTSLTVAFLTALAAAPATAEQCWDGQRAYRCNYTPTLAPKGQAPIHRVVTCLTGSESVGYQEVPCNDPRAHRIDAEGRLVACFVGETGVVGYDLVEYVHEGAPYYHYRLFDDTWVPGWIK